MRCHTADLSASSADAPIATPLAFIEDAYGALCATGLAAHRLHEMVLYSAVHRLSPLSFSWVGVSAAMLPEIRP